MVRSEQTKVAMKFHHNLDSQMAFAKLSGDFNPIHLDPEQARRTLFGRVVAHGVHNVLCSLEQYFGNEPRNEDAVFRLDRLNVTFQNPVFLDEEVSVVLEKKTENMAQLALLCGDEEVAKISLMGQMQYDVNPSPSLTPPDFTRQPIENNFATIEQDEGEIGLVGQDEVISEAFPYCARVLGNDGVARLLGLTRLVGMQCPGLHSLFSAFDVRFSSERSPQPTRYRVIRADDRISMLNISVEGGGMSGTVTAFMRPAPVNQPGMSAVKQEVNGEFFKGHRALIVGGSRGLGEISAKIIASGGGEAVITYLSGKDDAKEVSREISQAGQKCQILQLDVSDPEPALEDLAKQNWFPTHLLYFATPRISTRKTMAAAEDFKKVYSDGLKNVVNKLQNMSTGPLTLFYPSSVYVDGAKADLVDYAEAKAHGEQTALELAEKDHTLNIIIDRMPPLNTDQTASLLDVDATDPLEYMVRLYKEKLC